MGLDDTFEVFEHAKTASTREAATTTLLKKFDVDILMFFFHKQTGKRKVQMDGPKSTFRSVSLRPSFYADYTQVINILACKLEGSACDKKELIGTDLCAFFGREQGFRIFFDTEQCLPFSFSGTVDC